MSRWRGWWRIVRVDQWGVFFLGAMLGHDAARAALCDLPAAGHRHPRTRHQRRARASVGAAGGPFLAGVIAFLGVWILFKTQLDILEGMVRAITDILWTGSQRVRAWRGGDVRAVYYAVLAVVVLWGIVALRLAQPIVLLQIAANMAGIVFVIASLHLLYLNTRLLPGELRPPMWRRAGAGRARALLWLLRHPLRPESVDQLIELRWRAPSMPRSTSIPRHSDLLYLEADAA